MVLDGYWHANHYIHLPALDWEKTKGLSSAGLVCFDHPFNSLRVPAALQQDSASPAPSILLGVLSADDSILSSLLLSLESSSPTQAMMLVSSSAFLSPPPASR